MLHRLYRLVWHCTVFLCFIPFSIANEANLTLDAQRQTFLQLEKLLLEAQKQRTISPTLLSFVAQFSDQHYPLQQELDWQVLKAKLASDEAQDPTKLQNWIRSFSAQYPTLASQQKLDHLPLNAYYQRQQFAELLDYASKLEPPLNAQHQCYLFSARFQQLTAQQQRNPKTKQSEELVNRENAAMTALFNEFTEFWVEQNRLASECLELESEWKEQGRNTPAVLEQKAVRLFQQNAIQALTALIEMSPNDTFTDWLNGLVQLRQKPDTFANFVHLPVNKTNQQIILDAFPRFIKTLPEQHSSPDFSPYQQWATDWQLSVAEQKAWKVSFIQRLFDNTDQHFQRWRDEQILQLQDDGLTERRLRLAIRQKEDLNQWLKLLSNTAQHKAEWRYWWAKANPSQAQSVLLQLAQERGFYPMLAAKQLNQPYIFTPLNAAPLTDLQKNALKLPLARIAELRALNRLGAAKTEWLLLLQQSDFAQKLALADYANQQQWFDLGVEATIQATAWDYLTLRLPNAYANWFELLLAESPVSKSFAMAIARQESAWNTQARSHANAIGLMQMLPSTAQETAKQFDLPYRNENDLLSPLHNLLLGTAHLRYLNEKYPNNRILIAAAYNAGSHRVNHWLARANGKLTLDEFVATIPFYETRGYVQNVLAYDYYYQMLYQPAKTPTLFTAEEQRRY